MRILRAALAVLVLSSACAAAQLATLASNYYQEFGAGLTVGSNVSVAKPGTLRWDPASDAPQFHSSLGWQAFGLGSSMITNFGWGMSYDAGLDLWSVDPTVFVNTNLGFGLIGSGLAGDPLRVDGDQVVFHAASNRQEGAFVAWDGEAYESVFGPRLPVMTVAEALALHAATNLASLLPGAMLLALSPYAAAGSEHLYVANSRIDLQTNHPPGDSTWIPNNLSPTNGYWTLFSKQGETGPAGAAYSGPLPLDGVGQLLFGPWERDRTYVWASNALPVVSYDGQWYELLEAATNSIGDNPSSSPAVWAVSVAKGSSGTLVAWTNIVDRGTWDVAAVYTNLDAVWDRGNYYVVAETNIPPTPNEIAHRPAIKDIKTNVGTNSPHWTVLIEKGERGEQGAEGALTQVFTSYLLGSTNLSFRNGPSTTNRGVRWVSGTAADAQFEFTGEAWLGTNFLSASNGLLHLNNLPYSSGVSTGTNSTQAYPGDLGHSLSGRVAGVESNCVVDANKTLSQAVVADGTVTLSATSVNWRVTITNQVATNWSVVDDDIGSLVAFSLLVDRGTNEFAWGGDCGGATNSVPPTNATCLRFLVRYPAATYYLVDP